MPGAGVPHRCRPRGSPPRCVERWRSTRHPARGAEVVHAVVPRGGAELLPLRGRRPGAAQQVQVLAEPGDVQAQLAAADVEVLSDRVEEAVQRLVGLVRRTGGDDREAVRARLLELFSVLDPQDPRVLAGRRALANALF